MTSRSSARAGWRVLTSDPMTAAVVALGITQITAWGTSYYCLGVLAKSIGADMGWSRGFVFLGFTVALLAMGVVSSPVGRVIDRYGGRVVMTLGTVLLFAVINLVVCLPLHWFGLARRETSPGPAAPTPASPASPDGPPLEGRARSIAIGLFTLIMSLNGFVFGVISVQLVPLLEAAGLA